MNVRPFDFDQGLMAGATAASLPRVSIYPFPLRAVVAGRGSDIRKEIRTDRVQADHIPVFRRKGGGCSVFLDPGNLIVSIAFPAKGLGGLGTLFRMSGQWLIRGLKKAGFHRIHLDGVSDLVMDDRKIGGACFYRAKGFAYYSAAILVAPDLDGMDRYLAHPPREPAYRRGRPHKAFVSGLARFAPGISAEALARSLGTGLDPLFMARAA